jgi:hypothetical protein
MIKDFTHERVSENNSTKERHYENPMPVNLNPSDWVIKNLLNYSKALTAVSCAHTVDVNLVLLN